MVDNINQMAAELAEQLRNPTITHPLQPAHHYGEDSDDFMLSFSGPRSFSARELYIKSYGFVLVSAEVLAALVKLFKDLKVLEVGSGTGYLAKTLEDQSIDITAVDNVAKSYRFEQTYKRDFSCDAVELLPGDYQAVLMCWPCLNSDFAMRVAQAMKPGQILVYQGEGPGGCTASDDFFDYIRSDAWIRLHEPEEALNDNHVQFVGIHDNWYVLQKA